MCPGIWATDHSFGKRDRTYILSTCRASIINEPLIENDRLLFKRKDIVATAAGSQSHGDWFLRGWDDTTEEKSILFFFTFQENYKEGKRKECKGTFWLFVSFVHLVHSERKKKKKADKDSTVAAEQNNAPQYQVLHKQEIECWRSRWLLPCSDVIRPWRT